MSWFPLVAYTAFLTTEDYLLDGLTPIDKNV
jgi:hypothetical protein